MRITRLSLREIDYSSQVKCSGSSITVQDETTSTPAMVMRLANGVVTPEMLKNGCTYTDLGLPPNLDRFELMEMARDNAAEIVRLQKELEEEEKKKKEKPDPKPDPEEPAPSA